MLYIISHRYFAIEHILAGLNGRTDIRAVYYDDACFPRTRLKKWLWLADGLAGTHFCGANAFIDPLRTELRSMQSDDRVLFFDV